MPPRRCHDPAVSCAPIAMEDALILQDLENLATVLGAEVRYEDLDGEGGLCRYRGRTCLILNRAMSVPQRVGLVVRLLRRFPLDDVFIRPRVRALLEAHPDAAAGVGQYESGPPGLP